jgi:hypothetical protein
MNPIESYVDCFGSALFDSFVENACGAGVVCLNKGSWLWMPNFNESGVEGNGIAGVVEQGAEFRLCC